MPVEIPPDHMAVAWHHDYAYVTGEMINTCAFSISGFAGTPEDALNAISAAWGAGPQGLHVTGIQYVKATAMYNDPIFGDRALESTVGAAGGSAGPPPLPMNCAVIVQKTTSFAGRKFRGRMFFGGVAAGALAAGSPNEVDTSALTNMQTVFSTLKSDLLAVDIVPVLLHQTTGPSPTAISAFEVHALIGTMRKRIR